MAVIGLEAKSTTYKMAYGTHTTTAASNTIRTGLKKVLCAVAQLQSAPIATGTFVAADVGNQSGAPAAGSILIKSYMATNSTTTTPIASTTTFGLVVNWIAFGY